MPRSRVRPPTVCEPTARSHPTCQRMARQEQARCFARPQPDGTSTIAESFDELHRVFGSASPLRQTGDLPTLKKVSRKDLSRAQGVQLIAGSSIEADFSCHLNSQRFWADLSVIKETFSLLECSEVNFALTTEASPLLPARSTLSECPKI